MKYLLFIDTGNPYIDLLLWIVAFVLLILLIGVFADLYAKYGYGLFNKRSQEKNLENEQFLKEFERQYEEKLERGEQIDSRSPSDQQGTLEHRNKSSRPSPALLKLAKNTAQAYAKEEGSYPVTIVVSENGKVVHQELVQVPQSVPAMFVALQMMYPNAKISIESIK